MRSEGCWRGRPDDEVGEVADRRPRQEAEQDDGPQQGDRAVSPGEQIPARESERDRHADRQPSTSAVAAGDDQTSEQEPRRTTDRQCDARCDAAHRDLTGAWMPARDGDGDPDQRDHRHGACAVVRRGRPIAEQHRAGGHAQCQHRHGGQRRPVDPEPTAPGGRRGGSRAVRQRHRECVAHGGHADDSEVGRQDAERDAMRHSSSVGGREWRHIAVGSDAERQVTARVDGRTGPVYAREECHSHP